ncbi:CLUMA_CG019138, isoform A [Clunio marinus]|uniref:UDP-N-acetylglucosamine transferase subunit ALG14 n=1 Tax=Clunio marinus TaxID=568069 RepID=A0A1J1J103_9DIPT|nr:CLUMA_CG019138, isoform A [Clunio marinus]
MFILFISAVVGFAIGRVISLLLSQLFQQRVQLFQDSARTLIVLGSGGHTTEMLEIVNKLNFNKYTPRYYVVAENDQNSVDKLLAIEENKKDYKIYMITRSRKVHQSYASSIITTSLSFLNCIPILMHARPNLILCNGPGTCVPLCIVAFLFKVFYINNKCKIAFIESFCRVKSLSLSGKILLYLTDIFVVQWPDVSKISRKILYFGRLT